MNPKIRKIIAREWFVIMLLIAAGYLTFIIGAAKYNTNYYKAVKIDEQYTIKYSEDGKISSVNGKVLNTEDDFKALSGEEFKAIKDSNKLVSRAFDIYNNTNLMIIVLIIGYFIYLLIRCVIWKVKKIKLGKVMSVVQEQNQQAEVKLKFYTNPEFIYIFMFLFGFLALPLVWITPYMDKKRKILLSLVVVFFILWNISGKNAWNSFLMLIMVMGWLYKTDKYIFTKELLNKQSSPIAQSKEPSKKAESIKIIVNDGIWVCPVCDERNLQINDVCRSCRQEIIKP